jgi:hypothetical protein
VIRFARTISAITVVAASMILLTPSWQKSTTQSAYGSLCCISWA